jgi:hypothetical protein
LAWFRQALVNVGLAIGSDESSWADAGVLVNSVNAFSVVLARVSCAIINVDFAIGSCPSGCAMALVGVDEIFALASVQTWEGVGNREVIRASCQ